LAKAKKKEALKECKIIEGDAEDLPFPTDYADRYVSAGRYCVVNCVYLTNQIVTAVLFYYR
jgi:ubiquinone/menaquinone biosynthesis C-methylase UbiE